MKVYIDIEAFKKWVKNREGWENNGCSYVFKNDLEGTIFFKHNKNLCTPEEKYELCINYLNEDIDLELDIDYVFENVILVEIFNLIQDKIAYIK